MKKTGKQAVTNFSPKKFLMRLTVLRWVLSWLCNDHAYFAVTDRSLRKKIYKKNVFFVGLDKKRFHSFSFVIPKFFLYFYINKKAYFNKLHLRRKKKLSILRKRYQNVHKGFSFAGRDLSSLLISAALNEISHQRGNIFEKKKIEIRHSNRTDQNKRRYIHPFYANNIVKIL